MRETVELALRDLAALRRRLVEDLLDLAELLVEEGSTLPDGYVAVRLHVVGDFYHPDYAAMWLEVVDETRHLLRYWTYTRSWWVERVEQTYRAIGLERPRHLAEQLLDYLQELRRRPNFTLYASTDPTTPDITERSELRGWLEAGIEVTYNRGSKPCPEIPCIVCTYCIYGRGHVRFLERRKVMKLARPWTKPLTPREWRRLATTSSTVDYVRAVRRLWEAVERSRDGRAS
jgi:hypothetical protein